MLFFGIDPGASGAIAAINAATGRAVSHIKNTSTDRELWRWLQIWIGPEDTNHRRYFAVIEKVHAMPRQGVTSTFKFGASYGGLKMLLACAGVPFEEVTPAKWQKSMGCLTKGDKNVTKRKAQEMFPSVKMTHALADAYLLAAYAREKELALAPKIQGILSGEGSK